MNISPLRLPAMIRERSRPIRSSLCVLAILVLTLGRELVAPTLVFANNDPQQNQQQDQQQAPPQVICNLVVPPNPLTAQGLATPYQLESPGQNNNNGGNNGGDTDGDNNGGNNGNNNQQCDETNKAQSAFVQATILDSATGALSVYDPLVINAGTKPAVPPVVPNLPPNAVVGISFGFNGNSLTLVDNQGSLALGNCVNGQPTIFGQVAFCNNQAFFQAANQAGVKPPALGMAQDGQVCPTVRDFSVVDQDQSDNVTSNYLVSGKQLAQDTTVNRTNLPNAVPISNGSDNALIDVFINPAIGCQPWVAADLADPQGPMVTSQHLDELQAAADQQNPVAMVPALDPMVLDNNQPSLTKVNLYRSGVDQPLATSLADADTTAYCQGLLQTGLPRIAKDQTLTSISKTPDPQMANSLFTFLAMRFQASYTMLNCAKSLGVKNPVTLQMQNNVVTSAQIKLNAVPGNAGIGTQPTPIPVTGAGLQPTPIPNTGLGLQPTPIPVTGAGAQPTLVTTGGNTTCTTTGGTTTCTTTGGTTTCTTGGTTTGGTPTCTCPQTASATAGGATSCTITGGTVTGGTTTGGTTSCTITNGTTTGNTTSGGTTTCITTGGTVTGGTITGGTTTGGITPTPVIPVPTPIPVVPVPTPIPVIPVPTPTPGTQPTLVTTGGTTTCIITGGATTCTTMGGTTTCTTGGTTTGGTPTCTCPQTASATAGGATSCTITGGTVTGGTTTGGTTTCTITGGTVTGGITSGGTTTCITTGGTVTGGTITGGTTTGGITPTPTPIPGGGLQPTPVPIPVTGTQPTLVTTGGTTTCITTGGISTCTTTGGISTCTTGGTTTGGTPTCTCPQTASATTGGAATTCTTTGGTVTGGTTTGSTPSCTTTGGTTTCITTGGTTTGGTITGGTTTGGTATGGPPPVPTPASVLVQPQGQQHYSSGSLPPIGMEGGQDRNTQSNG